MGRVVNNWQDAISPSVQSLTYTYDLLGDMLTSSVPGAGTFTNAYNTAARLTGSTIPFTGNAGGGPTTLLSAAHYNALGRPTAQALGNGLNEAWTYDDRGRIGSYTLTNGSGSVYSYNLSYFPEREHHVLQ